jgi:hypothetical protein
VVALHVDLMSTEFLFEGTPSREHGYLAPMEILTKDIDCNVVLNQARTFGCPAYVLDPVLQDGKKLPKWKPRSRRGQFLGISPTHSSTIGLIRNLNTGFISPQFHVLFDELFQTIHSDQNALVTDPIWEELMATSRVLYVAENERDTIPPLHNNWLTENERREREQNARYAPRNTATRHHPRQHPPVVYHEEEPPEKAYIEEDMVNPEGDAAYYELIDFAGEEVDANLHGNDEVGDEVGDEAGDGNHGGGNFGINEDNVVAGRPQRERKLNPRFYGDQWVNFACLAKGDAFLVLNLNFESPPKSHQAKLFGLLAQELAEADTGIYDFLHPMALAIKANDEDTPSYREAMGGSDRVGFLEAMEVELAQLVKKETWTVVPRTEAEAVYANILGVIWAFKRKRFPDGSIRKLKSRLVCRGDQQIKGVDFFDPYAPVVSWTTVRTLLTMSCVLGLETKQVDYTLAFCQAYLDEPVYCEMPPRFTQKGHVLKLKKSLYGLSQAPLLFFEAIRGAMIDRGFRPSDNDECLFIHKDMICLIWVDDCLFFSREEGHIDDMIKSLQESYDLNIEDSAAGFLGIDLRKQADGSIELRQDGLINRILALLQLTDGLSNSAVTPAENGAMGSDVYGEDFSETWNYRSGVGMMMYLASNSRPEIAFAVHQCARFAHNPKKSHGQALKRIGRYLLGTKNKGMIMKPNNEYRLDCYVDSDYAGLWNHEDVHDPICVRSRTGFVLTFAGVPIVWSSKLQTETALSTLEAEYCACSTAVKTLIPTRRMVEEVCQAFKVKRDPASKVCKVWEDNAGALILANTRWPRLTPRSKHIAVKYHWFKEHIVKGEIEVLKIATKDQKADGFTKGLPDAMFKEHRLMVCGW